MEIPLPRVSLETNAMADIIALPAGGRTRAASRIRIDMTPLVDLAFLLITFFIFTTSISEPLATKLAMPKSGPPMSVKSSGSLTILLGANDRAFAYAGEWSKAQAGGAIRETTYDVNAGIGRIIRAKQMEMDAAGIDRSSLVVLIKPGDESRYDNLVNALDEMLINGVKKYAIVDPDEQERRFLFPHS
ncbi:MAG: hypothetical protein JWP27_2402 [Flaviaesturariibacter sp.]|nr:hypothetical protein [Flaviaesturariibacter sp.]